MTIGARRQGQNAIYRPKDGDRVQGTLTAEGTRLFEVEREMCSKQEKRRTVSDADTIDHIVRALAAARRVLRKTPPK